MSGIEQRGFLETPRIVGQPQSLLAVMPLGVCSQALRRRLPQHRSWRTAEEAPGMPQKILLVAKRMEEVAYIRVQ
jgi:hypothetical protein